MRRVTILGSTGSIGENTLDVIRRQRDRFEVFALVAGRNLAKLVPQVVEFRPRLVVIEDAERLSELRERLRAAGCALQEVPELDWGPAGRVRAATAPEVDIVMSAIVGIAGLEATYEAVRRGKRIGLAAKEVLVACGKLVVEASRAAGSELIPVDSEHNGVHQCMRAGSRDEVQRVILTASGGPFLETPKQELARVTPQQALRHPTWRMGKRITIDSATMMNKGFEVIEACWLFDLRP
ncbi:MAG: 1-deoxy-D-xylulose-5-phosphate reductoisomerase, partial [Bryobacterales bacterium]|nr:1-deoxy-D-xylulose-5-phosphate reductoisomerase [Bryobacteraceae bacterium]MDW8129996.1 1-deoxy-D-xylulose-5-phosphate reductoisomerase [Bryobacterales bacterium]